MVGHFLFLNYFKQGRNCGFDVSTQTFRKSLKLGSINIKPNNGNILFWTSETLKSRTKFIRIIPSRNFFVSRSCFCIALNRAYKRGRCCCVERPIQKASKNLQRGLYIQRVPYKSPRRTLVPMTQYSTQVCPILHGMNPFNYERVCDVMACIDMDHQSSLFKMISDANN